MVNKTDEQGAVTRVASKLCTTMNWLVPMPAAASPQERRSYYIAAIGYPAGIVLYIKLDIQEQVNNHDFICDPQGRIEAKGKGEMDVWYVQREKSLRATTNS